MFLISSLAIRTRKETRNTGLNIIMNSSFKEKEETVLQSMIDKLIESGRCCDMKMNVEKTKVMRILRQPSAVTIMIDQKDLENVECFKYLCSMLTDDGTCTGEIKCGIPMAKTAFNMMKTTFTGKLDLNLRNNLVKCYIWSMAFLWC